MPTVNLNITTKAHRAGSESSDGALVDRFGRVHRDLRISLTDRCSLRCTYCMPEQGNDWLAKSSVLTADEIIQVATVAVAAGISTFRLTGGEPLLRTDVVDVVRRLAQLRGPSGAVDVAMTTNGIRLVNMLPDLVDAGLTRLNVSIDTLDRQRPLRLATSACEDPKLAHLKCDTPLACIERISRWHATNSLPRGDDLATDPRRRAPRPELGERPRAARGLGEDAALEDDLDQHVDLDQRPHRDRQERVERRRLPGKDRPLDAVRDGPEHPPFEAGERGPGPVPREADQRHSAPIRQARDEPAIGADDPHRVVEAGAEHGAAVARGDEPVADDAE